jgi:hypothetical protein
MDILLIHGLSIRSKSITSVLEHELLIPNTDQHNSYYVLNANDVFPKRVKNHKFDGVIFTSTFMDLISDPSFSKRITQKFDFLSSARGYKIALPQDDYWMSEIRDAWYTRMRINCVYPVCAPEHWNTLLPTYSKSGEIVQGYTAYIGPRLLKMWEDSLPADAKSYDIVYRSTKFPLYPNTLGFLKGSLGEKFEELAIKCGFDFSLNVTGEFIKGDKWEDFLKDSKAILGSPSGSSTLVRGESDLRAIRAIKEPTSVRTYENLDSLLPSECLGVDYTAISPRNLEAAALGCLQILTPGSYGNILKPGRDYLSLDFTFENLKQIDECLRNETKLSEITNNCWSSLRDHTELQVENFVEGVLTRIAGNSNLKPKANQSNLESLLSPTILERVHQLVLGLTRKAHSVSAVIKNVMLLR